ncbi:IclR family transcriptional regulator [Kineococcus auxinigenes]|uniref:IclR family transcriptional regulator n=1 Tax=unclassified Kineococcus TaxID=2621656 RepID=UPI003D7E1D50
MTVRTGRGGAPGTPQEHPGSPRGAAGAPGGASASEKTLLVLEAALQHRRFTDVVEATGLAKTTTHRILATLAERGFVVVTAEGWYLPGPKLLSMAGQALQRIDISALAQPYVDELVQQVRCTVHLGVANGDEIVYLIRADSDKPYRMPSRVGHAIPLHTSGIGKVVLAAFTDDGVQRYAARTGLPARTANTITTAAGLLDEVRRVRECGYALDREENVPGVGCVAAPVRDHTGTVRYGVSISTITLEHDLEQIEAMAGLAVATARRISAALGHSTPATQDRTSA